MLRRTSGKRGVASRVYPPGASHSPTAACPVPCAMFADRCLTCTLPCPVRALSWPVPSFVKPPWHAEHQRGAPEARRRRLGSIVGRNEVSAGVGMPTPIPGRRTVLLSSVVFCLASALLLLQASG